MNASTDFLDANIEAGRGGELADLNRQRRRFGVAPIDGGSRLERPSSGR